MSRIRLVLEQPLLQFPPQPGRGRTRQGDLWVGPCPWIAPGTRPGDSRRFPAELAAVDGTAEAVEPMGWETHLLAREGPSGLVADWDPILAFGPAIGCGLGCGPRSQVLPVRGGENESCEPEVQQ